MVDWPSVTSSRIPDSSRVGGGGGGEGGGGGGSGRGAGGCCL